jgi:hypothetical protein
MTLKQRLNIEFMIGWYYHILGMMGKKLSEEKKSPITIMIDAASGYDRQRLTDVINILSKIKKLKQKIKADTSREEQALAELNLMRKP